MEQIKYSFTKEERLTHKTVISELFTNGKGYNTYPFRIVWKSADLRSKFPCQVAITVSKKKFKLAVTRNLLKRRIREIYRLNKHELYTELENNNSQIAFMIVYLPKEILSSEEMESRLKKALNRLPKEYEKSISKK